MGRPASWMAPFDQAAGGGGIIDDEYAVPMAFS